MSAPGILLFLVISIIYCVESARILAVYPTPSLSHQVVFRSFTSELVRRGHEVVVVTPNPMYVNETSPDNLTEIDTSSSYEIMSKSMNVRLQRGIVMRPNDINIASGGKFFADVDEAVFENEQFKKILNDKTKKFDLVIVEALFHAPLSIAKKYNAPSIWFSSFYGMEYNFAAFGAPTHPYFFPHPYRNKIYDLTIWERIYEMYLELKFWYFGAFKQKCEQDFLNKYVKGSTDDVYDLAANVDLMFVNTNPLFEGIRPVPPNVVHLGGLHMKPVEKLPKALDSYLHSTSRGVIFVSLGTNVDPRMMDPDLLDVFLKAFQVLPYEILWKFPNASFPYEIKNIQTSDWYPQRDLLYHPNVKAFITQGGLQSTDEAIDAGVPMVGIPMMVDQGYNVAQYVRLGIGVKLDPLTLTATDIVNGVKKVIEDKSYKENIRKVKELIQDQPQTPLQRAIWWTEYVLRHRGAKFLRAPTANVSWTTYYQLDVVAVLLIAVSTLLFVVYKIAKLFFVYVSKTKTSKKEKVR